MDFNHLRTFLEISKRKSFSRAAEKLRITQPSISAQVRTMETYIGHRLFDRSGGKVSLTAAGRVFEPFAEESLQRLNHIMLTINDLERSPRGSLTISANESTALYVLPNLFRRFKKQYPRVSLNIVRAERSSTIDAVVNREADFGVVSLPVKDTKLVSEIIHDDDLVLAVPTEHPLVSMETVTLQDLGRYNLLLPPQGRRRQMFDQMFLDAKVTPRIAMELDSSELIKRLILADVGIGFLPRINILAELKTGQLKEIQVENVHLKRRLGLIFHKEMTFTRAGTAFYQVATGK